MLRRLAFASAAAFLVTSCGGDSGGVGNPTPPPPTPVPTSVTVGGGATTLTALGATTQLAAQVRDQNGSVINGQAVTWSSEPQAVATVSASGLVTAVSPGSAEIRATAGSATGTVTVTVDQAPASVAKVLGDTQSGVVGATLGAALSVTVQDSGGNPVEAEAVTFAVTSGGGTVTPTSATTGADGRASATWTLGTDATQAQTVQATAGGVSATFSATAQPGPAQSLEKVSGDGQSGAGGGALAAPLVVALEDAFGNGIPGAEVTWAAAAGNGSLDPTTATTAADGTAQTSWTLDGAAGVQTATASAAGFHVDFTATSGGAPVAPTISGVTPATLVAGQAATVDGENFSATANLNTVTIDGLQATVTGASTTALQITVPDFGCRPARTVAVQVNSGGLDSAPSDHPLNPESFTTLTSGEQTVISGGGNVCVQLPPDPAGGDYLLGVQRVTEMGTDLGPVRLTSRVDPGAGAVAPSFVAQDAPMNALVDPDLVRRVSRRAAESRLMEINAETIRRYGGFEAQARASAAGAAAASGAAAVPGGDVGDQVTLKVRDFDAGATCDEAATITATIAAVSSTSVWFLDNANPAGGFTNADVQAIATTFDNVVLPAHSGLFGPLSDVDGDSRVAVIISHELNQIELGEIQGFVSSCDFVSTTPSSNFGEVFYARSPDPDAVHGRTLTVQDITDELPFVAAHEVTHVKQLFDRMINSQPVLVNFILEGQATSSEEIVGFAVLGDQEGQNYGFQKAFQSATDWYVGQFADLAAYFGVNPGETEQVAGAPEACTFVSDEEAAPCIGRALWYGVSASFFRWIVDNLLPGQASTFHQALINSQLNGFTLVENVAGQTMLQMLPPWSAALYLDDRAAVASELTFSSWDLLDIFEGGGLIATARLIPRARAFQDFLDETEIRGGSTAYWRISGGSQPGTALEVLLQSGAGLPGEYVVYLVPIP